VYTGLKLGAYEEYLCACADKTAVKIPDSLSFEEAAALPHGGTSALYFLRKSNIDSGKKILIYGASGAVGTYAVQLANYYGAHVTGVCSSSNLETVSSLGADRVLDYTKEDFSEQKERYDIVFDAVGKSSKSNCRKVLAEGGSYVTVGGLDAAKVRLEDLNFLITLVESGKIRPYIDKCYPLEQISEAHAYADTGHKTGNVVIQIG
jgi:NADPH:quinone reductase-like Zn-dependent oxidoreductase